jgi:hypothetical protein
MSLPCQFNLLGLNQRAFDDRRLWCAHRVHYAQPLPGYSPGALFSPVRLATNIAFLSFIPYLTDYSLTAKNGPHVYTHTKKKYWAYTILAL